jgi:hypothetical protein
MVHYSLPLNATSLEEKFEKHINSQQLKEVGDYKEKINNFFWMIVAYKASRGPGSGCEDKVSSVTFFLKLFKFL